MSNWVKVTKAVFSQIAEDFDAEWFTHGFTVDEVPAGAMVVVDEDEDCYWFDYYVTKEMYTQLN